MERLFLKPTRPATERETTRKIPVRKGSGETGRIQPGEEIPLTINARRLQSNHVSNPAVEANGGETGAATRPTPIKILRQER